MAIDFRRNAKSDYEGPASDHWDGKHFRNRNGRGGKKFAQFVKWQLLDRRHPWPAKRENLYQPKLDFTLSAGQMALTFVNHATMLIQIDGMNILTDPVWSERVSPFRTVGPKRVRRPGIEFDNLPKIDIVLVSHNHYDHLDVETLKRLSKRDEPAIFVALGDKKSLLDTGVRNVFELDWWQSQNFLNAKCILSPHNIGLDVGTMIGFKVFGVDIF